MTDPLQRLDPELLFSRAPLSLYRVARRNYAVLSGAGAAAYPGRWNQLGQRAVYTSTEQGTTILERLVHTSKQVIPSGLILSEIRLSGTWARFGSSYRDERTGAEIMVCPSLVEAVNARDSVWRPTRFGGHPFAIAVPSVILPVWNVVLYPEAHGFTEHLFVNDAAGFEFDPRLFPEDAMAEFQ